MKSNMPTSEQVRAQLVKLGHAQMQELATRSGVPFTTLWKVRSGVTSNPGLTTVNRFLPHIERLKPAKATA